LTSPRSRASSKSKCQSRWHMISRCSMYDRFRPIHPLGPYENGCDASLTCSGYLSLPESSHRSGAKVRGSLKCSGEWEADHVDTETVVCIFQSVKLAGSGRFAAQIISFCSPSRAPSAR
jgi:hypothetical protein